MNVAKYKTLEGRIHLEWYLIKPQLKTRSNLFQINHFQPTFIVHMMPVLQLST